MIYNFLKGSNSLPFRNVMIMRHKGARGISTTALENSDRRNLCGIIRVSTGRFICKTKFLSTEFEFRKKKFGHFEWILIKKMRMRKDLKRKFILTLLMWHKLCLLLCSNAVGFLQIKAYRPQFIKITGIFTYKKSKIFFFRCYQ
jgi:hypothetical protein